MARSSLTIHFIASRLWFGVTLTAARYLLTGCSPAAPGERLAIRSLATTTIW
jgi:hypothetical protein